MKRILTALTAILPAAAMLLFVFSSCGISADAETQGYRLSPSAATEAFFGMYTGPSQNPADREAALAPVQSVGELPDEYTDSIIKNELLLRAAETPDGFLLPSTTEAGKTCVTKYDRNGTLVWSREYDAIPVGKSWVEHTIAPAPDGGFVLGTAGNTYKKRDGSWVFYDQTLLRCDKEGNELWNRQYKGYGAGIFRKIFCLPDGGIITAGCNETPITNKAGISNYPDIYFSKLDKDGSLLEERAYGGAGSDLLYEAGYIEGRGIAALIQTESKDGTFSASKDGYGEAVLAFLDGGLEITRQQILPRFTGYYGMFVSGGSIFTIQYITEEGDQSCKLRMLDTEGNECFSKCLEHSFARYVPGSSGGVTLQVPGKLVKLDMSGNEISEAPFEAGAAAKIIEYEDYFLVISDNITGRLPQPPQTSALWYGRETVYSGYDYSGKLLWRGTYDNTPDYMKNYDPEH